MRATEAIYVWKVFLGWQLDLGIELIERYIFEISWESMIYSFSFPFDRHRRMATLSLDSTPNHSCPVLLGGYENPEILQ